MNDDTLSEVLRAVRLKGAVFFDVDTAAPWVAEAPEAQTIAAAVMPDAEHVIEYHVITNGSCWASVVGRDETQVHLHTGDVVAFPQGDAHVLSSAPGMRGEPDLRVFQQPAEGEPATAADPQSRWRHDRESACGVRLPRLRPRARSTHFLEALPRILHLRAAGNVRSGWLE